MTEPPAHDEASGEETSVRISRLALCASAAHAADPAPAQDTCEIACDYRQGDGPKRIVSCYERTDARQCTAIADHKNINDAYPAKMSCAAKLVPVCHEAREF